MSKGTGKRGDNLPRQELTGLFEVSMEEEDRSSSGIPELDRVLGGGIVKGSLTLVGGDPGNLESLLYSCRFAVIRQTVGKRLFMFQERNL